MTESLDTHERLSFVRRRMPGWVQVRVIVIAAGRARTFDQREWRDALVLIECGEVEMQFLSGRRQRMRRGDTAHLAGLPLLALHNTGGAPALLSTVTKLAARAPMSFAGAGVSRIEQPPDESETG